MLTLGRFLLDGWGVANLSKKRLCTRCVPNEFKMGQRNQKAKKNYYEDDGFP